MEDEKQSKKNVQPESSPITTGNGADTDRTAPMPVNKGKEQNSLQDDGKYVNFSHENKEKK